MTNVMRRRLKLCGNESALWELQRQLAAIWNERDRLAVENAGLQATIKQRGMA